MLKIGVIGCGYWGTHVLRNFNNSGSWELSWMCDKNSVQLTNQKNRYPETKSTEIYQDSLDDENINAVAIATPVDSHFQIAKDALLSGKHVWVEKPLTSTLAEAEELARIAKDKNLLLNVDHTFIYTPAVQKIKSIIESGELGDVLYFDSVRINLGLFQHDINVIWDLAPHDLSILSYCTNKKAVSVNATGSCVVEYSGKKIENLAYVTINFEDGSIAHFHVNWLSPVKIRKIIIGGSKKMLVFDDMENSEKIKLYDTGVSVTNKEDIYESLVQYRLGDMSSPALSNKEALAWEVEHFAESIISGNPTLTDDNMGVEVVKILEAANKSLRENGKLIEL